jgi:hypothetical protein
MVDVKDIISMHCAVCSRCDGEECPNGRVSLREVELLSKYGVELGADTSAILCSYCLQAVPFDLNIVMKECNRTMERSVANGMLLKGFIEAYIRDVWPDDEPPSYTHLVELVNAVGIRPPNARLWTYHNLKQKLDSLALDRHACLNEKSALSYAERRDELAAMAAAWLHARLGGNEPAPVQSAVGVELDELPSDMPGVLVGPGVWPADREDEQV